MFQSSYGDFVSMEISFSPVMRWLFNLNLIPELKQPKFSSCSVESVIQGSISSILDLQLMPFPFLIDYQFSVPILNHVQLSAPSHPVLIITVKLVLQEAAAPLSCRCSE